MITGHDQPVDTQDVHSVGNRYFTVVCLVAWPLNESEAGADLGLIETSLIFLCKLLLISMRTVSLT